MTELQCVRHVSLSTALQWEQIKAVGIRPEARHSHATVTMDAMQSTLFIFGG
jgi:hypothetical protein